ncbi:unnamed protein product [Effrenium voratum]|uniref:Uncharacterized protein n=1 Tax=Effrenium voratum TaxID=2562239 RepID=A0AA36IUI9_9DINO|nr:unnamed protein product [Effrenium voratum]CAJ1413314.1 unnamed protein product [Effrenium voratum]
MAPAGFGARKPPFLRGAIGKGLSQSYSVPERLQAASLRFGTTLTMRPVRGVAVRREAEPREPRPASAATISPLRPTSAYPRTRPQSAAATKLASQGFAAAMAQRMEMGEGKESRAGRSPSSSHIGNLVGRRRVAHLAAAAQGPNARPQRAQSAGALGCSPPSLRQFQVEERPRSMSGSEQKPRQEEGSCIFEEIMRTDDFFGPILQEIKASYKAVDERPASPAEIAVDAIRRPWLDEVSDSGRETERAAARRSLQPDQVRQLEKENAALRELLRRFHSELKRGSAEGRKAKGQAAASLSVWASPEPLAAAMRRPPRRRPTRVPALNLSQVDDLSDDYEEEEEEAYDMDGDDYEVYVSPGPSAFGGG